MSISSDFLFLGSSARLHAYRRDRWTDFDAQYVIRRGSAEGSAFWGLKRLNLKFTLFIRKIQKNYNGAYVENLQQI